MTGIVQERDSDPGTGSGQFSLWHWLVNLNAGITCNWLSNPPFGFF